MAIKAQLFITCLIDSFFPEIGLAMVRVLNRTGVSVGFPPLQTCQGSNAGFGCGRSSARTFSKKTVRQETLSADSNTSSLPCIHASQIATEPSTIPSR